MTVHNLLNRSFFLFLTLVILLTVPPIHAQTAYVTSKIVEPGQTGFANDKISLEENETLDLSDFILDVPQFVETVGTSNVILTQQVELIATIDGNSIVLENTELPTISVEISDQTKISGPVDWDNKISPPTEIETTGDIPSGFQTPDSVIQIGSPDVILIFDKTVTIILEGVTGQTAYKLPGEETWNLISGCNGDYENPDDPTFPNECSISNEIDTKIVTYHFTEFVGLEETPEDPPEDPIQSPKSSSGGGRTAVGPSSSSPGQVFVPVLPGEEEIKVKLPDWFRQVVFWWAEGKITEEEMNTAMQYLFKILK